MTTTIHPNGIKVHCVWQDGTHMKEGEKIPLEVQKKAVQSVLKMMKEEPKWKSQSKQHQKK